MTCETLASLIGRKREVVVDQGQYGEIREYVVSEPRYTLDVEKGMYVGET